MSISKFLINKKIVKNEKQADGLMIVIVVVCLLFLIIQNFGGSFNGTPGLTQEEIELLQEQGIDPNDPFFEGQV